MRIYAKDDQYVKKKQKKTDHLNEDVNFELKERLPPEIVEYKRIMKIKYTLNIPKHTQS